MADVSRFCRCQRQPSPKPPHAGALPLPKPWQSSNAARVRGLRRNPRTLRTYPARSVVRTLRGNSLPHHVGNAGNPARPGWGGGETPPLFCGWRSNLQTNLTRWPGWCAWCETCLDCSETRPGLGVAKRAKPGHAACKRPAFSGGQAVSRVTCAVTLPTGSTRNCIRFPSKDGQTSGKMVKTYHKGNS